MDLAPPPTDASPAPAPPSPHAADSPPPIIAGVAALLAERLDVDALWVRIAFVLLALVGGVGLVIYGAMWLAFVVGADPDRRWARVVGGAGIVFGLPLALTGDLTFVGGPLAVLGLLAGLAVALWQPRRSPTTGGTPPRPPAVATTPPTIDDDDRSSPTAPTGRRAPRLPRPPRRPARPPSILGRATLGVAILVGAVGALIDQANGGRLHPEQWLGAAAITCGIGLVIGAFAGRARWLILPAVVFAGAGLIAGEAARIGIEPSAVIGSESVDIGSGDPGGWRRQEHVVIGAVDVSIDSAPPSPVTVDARAGIGEVHVWAAADVTVEVRATVDHGDVVVDGVVRADGTYTIGPEGQPDVTVDARVGRGRIDVQQYSRAPLDDPGPFGDAPIGAEDRQDVAGGVTLTAGGRFVLAGGEAVLDVDGTVLVGSTVQRDRVTVISTSLGEFRLLPDRLLLTPSGELLDLAALQSTSTNDAATPVPSPSTVPAPPTIPGG